MIRELCIMIVRLVFKFGLGCEYLFWKRLFWERINFWLKSWGIRKKEEFYKLFVRLFVCCGGEGFSVYLGFCV